MSQESMERMGEISLSLSRISGVCNDCKVVLNDESLCWECPVSHLSCKLDIELYDIGCVVEFNPFA